MPDPNFSANPTSYEFVEGTGGSGNLDLSVDHTGDGSYSYKLIATTGSNNQMRYILDNASGFPITAGQLTFSFWVKGTAGNRVNCNLFNDSAGIWPDGETGVYAEHYVIQATDTWEQVTKTITAAVSGYAQVRVYNKTQGATIHIDDINLSPVVVPTVERTDFTFDDINDDEGFVGANATLTHAVSGEVQIDFTNKFPGITLTNTYHVPFANNLIAVTFNNASNANQIAVKVEDPANQFASSTIVAGSQTVTIDLGDKTSWNGDETTFTLQFKQLSGDPVAPIEHTGTVTIQQILFYSGSLGIDDVDFKDDTSISLYPSPVKDKLTINTPLVIEKIELFSVLGQKGMVQFGASNTLDTSSLSKGVYILKIHQENDKISTKRFIKN